MNQIIDSISIDNLSVGDNIEDLLFTNNNTESLAKQYLESFVREIAKGKNMIIILNLCFLNDTDLLYFRYINYYLFKIYHSSTFKKIV